jgi:hypothetical protein
MEDRVARAIFQNDPGDRLSRPAVLAARRAIKAMNEPTKAMVDKANRQLRYNTYQQEAELTEGYKAMIRAALYPNGEEG